MNSKHKKTLDTIINGVDTPLGKAFDVLLIWSILFSSLLLILDSVASIHAMYGALIQSLQTIFLVLFSIEFALRLYIAKSLKHYLFSFYGAVDFFAIAPIYLSYLIPGSSVFLIVRTLRLLRLFSVLKMGRYISASGTLMQALKASRTKITVFIITIIFLVTVVGAIMYLVEGPENGFASIPESMYWAVVTVSTVGYGDISPQTSLGKLIASAVMLMGYGIIAVPTGIITSEIAYAKGLEEGRRNMCPRCGAKKHYKQALFCHHCGEALNP